MNWLERARHEFGRSVEQHTASTAERNSTAASVMLYPAIREELSASIVSNGSAPLARIQKIGAPCEQLEDDLCVQVRGRKPDLLADLPNDEASSLLDAAAETRRQRVLV